MAHVLHGVVAVIEDGDVVFDDVLRPVGSDPEPEGAEKSSEPLIRFVGVPAANAALQRRVLGTLSPPSPLPSHRPWVSRISDRFLKRPRLTDVPFV